MLVGPDLRKLHPLPSKNRAVLAGKQGAHQAPGAELDGLDLFENFGSDGIGSHEESRVTSHELGTEDAFAGTASSGRLLRDSRLATGDCAHGTLTAPSTRVTTSSVVTSSASASKVSTIRWRRTSGAR